jgi:hypothetical protein
MDPDGVLDDEGDAKQEEQPKPFKKREASLVDSSVLNPYEIALWELIHSANASPRLIREKKVNFVALFAPACKVVTPRRPSLNRTRQLYENRFTYLSPRARELRAMQAQDGEIILKEALYTYDALLDNAIYGIAVFLETQRDTPLGQMGSKDLIGFRSEFGARKPVKVR